MGNWVKGTQDFSVSISATATVHESVITSKIKC